MFDEDTELTPKNVRIAESAQEWLDDQISILFNDYASVFNVWTGYGVEKYSIYHNQIVIHIDTSSHGCSNSETYVIPISWFYSKNRIQDMKEAYRLFIAEKDESKKKQIEAEKEKLRARLRDLENATN